MTTDVNSDLFRLLVAGVSDYGIFMLSPKGIVSSWNVGAERIKGYTASEIIGSHFSRFYPPDKRALNVPEQELRIASEHGRFEDEGWRLRKDGSRFWANVVITAMRGSGGEILGYSKITRDLTERRTYEQALKESEENFRLLVEGVKDHAIFLLDPEGNVMSWNAGAMRVHGYRAEEVLGQSFAMFYSPADVAAGKPQQALDIAKAAGFVEETGWRFKRDGTRFWADVTLTVLIDNDGSTRGFAKVTRNLSEHRRIEELERESRRINEFIAMLAHELRNPLAPIRNAVSIMAAKATSPDLVWCRDMIDRQVSQLTRLVDDLLDIGRVTSGKIQVEKEPVDLNSIVSASVESVHSALEGYGHKLELRLPTHPVRVAGDQTRLSQVIVNLVTNAAKFTPSGGLVKVELVQRGATAYLYVRDNGVGMSKQLIETAFDLFVQGERQLDRSEGGLGIGLTLVKRIVELHGGEVSVSSAGPGQGTEFVVSIPALEDDTNATAAAAKCCAGAKARKILVVDDNVDAADSLSMLLQLSGHELTVAHDGAEALRLVAEHVPDVILLDIGLPGMNGYEVAQRVRELPALARTQLIAMTGYGQESDKEAAAAAGFDAHLVKPVDYQVLTQMIEGLPRD